MAVSKTRKTTHTRTKATSAAEWKKGAAQPPLVETPTGKWIRMKKPGMTQFLEGGFLPDSLANAIRREINSAKARGGKKSSDAAIMKELTEGLDADAIMDLMASMDRIVCAVMVEPKVVWHKRPLRDFGAGGLVQLDQQGREILEEIPQEERRDDVVYTDEIEQEDKNFIFQAAVGGSTDLSRFRAEQASVMDALSAGQSVEETPERAPAPRP